MRQGESGDEDEDDRHHDKKEGGEGMCVRVSVREGGTSDLSIIYLLRC